MIWILLGFLLFGTGGGVADPQLPAARVQRFRDEIAAAVQDDLRRERAVAVVERLVAQVADGFDLVATLGERVEALDRAPELDEAGYRAALDDVLDGLDAADLRIVDLSMELRATITADEWTALVEAVGVPEPETSAAGG